MDWTESLADEAATRALGARLAARVPAGSLVGLRGDLGAGKTTLVRGWLAALGHEGPVRSPTYTLVETYVPPAGAPVVHHLDLYRLADPEELEWLGLRDLLTPDALCLVEWPQRGAGVLPEPDWDIVLRLAGTGREARIRSRDAAPAGSGLTGR